MGRGVDISVTLGRNGRENGKTEDGAKVKNIGNPIRVGFHQIAVSAGEFTELLQRNFKGWHSLCLLFFEERECGGCQWQNTPKPPISPVSPTAEPFTNRNPPKNNKKESNADHETARERCGSCYGAQEHEVLSQLLIPSPANQLRCCQSDR